MPDTSAPLESLERRYRRYAESGPTTRSPLQARVARAVSESPEALAAVARLPARRRGPALVLAALHYLALGGRAPAPAGALASGAAEVAAAAAVDLLVTAQPSVAEILAKRRAPVEEARPYGVLYPAVASAARWAGATTVGLVHVGSPTGLSTLLDRVRVEYDSGLVLGDPASPVATRCKVIGDRPVPAEPIPEVVARVAVHPEPFDPSVPDDALWLRASVAPDDEEGLARLDGELALATAAPPRSVRGSVLDALPGALAAVPVGALPVVMTTWSLSGLTVEQRRRFLRLMDEAAHYGPLAWVSAEGVGVAPCLPTLGDRPASGHSIVGLARFGLRGPRFEAAGRCWLRGAYLEWLTGG